MADNKWTGGFDRNDADNPKQWDPDAAPMPGGSTVQYGLADLPGPAVALNDAGQAVGRSVNPVNNFISTFLYQAGVVNTLSLGRSAIPVAINAVGQSVGPWGVFGDDPTTRTFIWDGSGPAETLSGAFTTSTRPSAINDSGELVGTFTGIIFTPHPAHAFSADNGVLTIFDPPGATSSSAVDINNAGQIVGSFTDASGQSHAFLDENGTFTTIEPSNSIWAQATHINPSGVVIGEHAVSGETPPGQEHAFIYDHGTVTALDQKGTALSVATAINGAGEVVGYYDDGSQSHAFAYENGVFFTIDPPGATSSAAVDINNLGQVVGNYSDATGSHVFVYDHGAFSTIDEPGATSISAAGVNNVGQIIGNYSNDTGSHGFIADPLASVRTWTGAASSIASDPANWSPSGTPQPGDRLLLPGGSTINISDDDLRGDPLIMSGTSAPATLNLSHHTRLALENDPSVPVLSNAVVNVSGADSLHVISKPPNPSLALSVTVNLIHHARLLANFEMTYGSLTISGNHHTEYVNKGTNILLGNNATINTDVDGSGSFQVSSAQVSAGSAADGRLEFNGSVSKDQTVQLLGHNFSHDGAIVAGGAARLQVDRPIAFHGTVDLQDLSLVDLVGLAKADSWSYKNDMLSIFNSHGKVVDRLHVVSDATSTGSIHGLSVSKHAAGDVVVSPGTDFHGSLALPTA
jgi:probable HAF family extracellular repeat protein